MMLYCGDEFEHKGRTYTFKLEPDEDHGAPWENEDGHGPVSEWTTRAKRPGEVLVAGIRYSTARYYDIQAAMKIALRDGWNSAPYTGTKRQCAARAVAEDAKRMREWCTDVWCYVGVVVTHPETGKSQSIWGIESDLREYITSTAHEVADELAADLDIEMAAAITASRPDMYATA